MAVKYYMARKPALLASFDAESQRWRPVIAGQYGQAYATTLIEQSRLAFQALLPHLPYIGGDDNHLTGALLDAAGCLALYQAMQAGGRTAEETGWLLYLAALRQAGEPVLAIPTSEMLTTGQLMERRRNRADRSQERRYPGDYVYVFIPGDGVEFDYGYDFLECAVQKFYRAQGAGEFTPFYCYLDFPKSSLGLRRTMTLAEGYPKCDHRFKAGRLSEHGWPPPFLKSRSHCVGYAK